jgi:hypothetical protein
MLVNRIHHRANAFYKAYLFFLQVPEGLLEGRNYIDNAPGVPSERFVASNDQNLYAPIMLTAQTDHYYWLKQFRCVCRNSSFFQKPANKTLYFHRRLPY